MNKKRGQSPVSCKKLGLGLPVFERFFLLIDFAYQFAKIFPKSPAVKKHIKYIS